MFKFKHKLIGRSPTGTKWAHYASDLIIMPHLLFHNYITAGLRFFSLLFFGKMFSFTRSQQIVFGLFDDSASQAGGKKKRRAKSDSLTKEPDAVVAVFPAGTSSPVDELKVRNNEREGMTCQHNASIVGTTKAAAEQQG